jgi:hypothetical protein
LQATKPPTSGTNFFPADPTLAPFPSPENSASTWDPNLKAVGGSPYLRDADGIVWYIRASDSALFRNGYNDGNTFANQIIIRQGEIYWTTGPYWYRPSAMAGSQTIPHLPAASATSLPTYQAIPEPVKFPPSPANASFPSPENAVSAWNGELKTIGGAPYLRDSDGFIYQIRASDSAVLQNGSTDGNTFAWELISRGGKIYWNNGGHWYLPNGKGGSTTIWPLPAAYAAPGGTAAAPGNMPADPPRPSVGPGSSGRTITAAPGQTLEQLLTSARPGDTIKLVAGRVYAEAARVSVPVVLDGGGRGNNATGGAIIDGLNIAPVGGKAGLLLVVDCILKGLEIRNWGLNDPNPDFICGIRNDAPGWYEISGCNIHDCQGGIGGSVVGATNWNIHDTTIRNCGNGTGREHNVYLGTSTLKAILTNVVSTVDPTFTNSLRQKVGGGYPLKSRANHTEIRGGTFSAPDAACIDIPDGSTDPVIIDGATLIKPAGSPDHKVINYAEESTTNGLAGLKVTHSTLKLETESPLFLIAGGVLTFDSTSTFSGNNPSVQGGGTMTGLNP